MENSSFFLFLGLFQITLDVLFDSRDNYERVVRSGVINRENICRAYNLQDKDITEVVFFDSAMGIKVTFNRKISSGSAFDRDVYGAQQHAPLMEFIIP